MATATITTIYCVKQATGTDIPEVAAALAGLPAKILPGPVGGVLDAIIALSSVGAIVAAVDQVQNDPDDLYVTTNTSGGRHNAIWPGPDQDVDIRAGQSVSPQIHVEFSDSQNISLWDYDSVSADDLLGSVTLLKTEQGQGEIAKLAKSTVENSYYYVVYRVD